MNIALIFAGGTGQRMNSKSRPKQFLELYGKPFNDKFQLVTNSMVLLQRNVMKWSINLKFCQRNQMEVGVQGGKEIMWNVQGLNEGLFIYSLIG